MPTRFRNGGSGVVLVVDDMDANVRLLERLLVREGYFVLSAADGEAAVEAVQQASPDVVLMDVRMPRLDGFSACRQLKQSPATRLVPVVLMTGAAEEDDRIQAIEAGADDFLRKPIDESELKARVHSLIRLKRFTDELDSAESVILSLGLTVEARDPNTRGHCQRLAQSGVALGQKIGLDEEDLEALHRGGYLHDLGKIAVPDAILMKRGPLTTEEMDIMKLHPVTGDRLCGNLRTLSRVRPIVRHHHERLDGSGYPDGLRGSAIPPLAQIVSIVDVYDALTTERPYNPAWPVEKALQAMRDEVACGWRDRELTEAFIGLVESGDVDWTSNTSRRVKVPDD
jgi:putative two-component system response regulator